MNTAILSSCGLYRYELTRHIQDVGVRATVIMVNPSTADAEQDDATIRKIIGFGKRLGWSNVTVVNKFAYRATDVNELHNASDPIGPLNDAHIVNALLFSDVVFVAWGSLNKLPAPLRNRWKFVAETARVLSKSLHCFGTCQDGHPKHPVMIGYDSPVQGWE